MVPLLLKQQQQLLSSLTPLLTPSAIFGYGPHIFAFKTSVTVQLELFCDFHYDIL